MEVYQISGTTWLVIHEIFFKFYHSHLFQIFSKEVLGTSELLFCASQEKLNIFPRFLYFFFFYFYIFYLKTVIGNP